MKIGGVAVTSCEELLVLPRSNGDDIPFRAIAVSINEDFDKLVRMPVPPMVITKEGQQPDFADKNYKKACSVRDDQRFAFMCIQSIAPSKIEWSKVDLEKPATWLGWNKELRDAGISEVECNRVVNLVMAANSLDERKIVEARKAFLLGQGQ